MNIITNIIWTVILFLLLVSLVTMLLLQHRYFTKSEIVCYFNEDGINKKKTFYKKIGSEITVSLLPIPSKYKDYELSYIKSEGDIQADLNQFIVPRCKVELYFEKVETKYNPVKKSSTFVLDVPESIKKLQEQQVKDVLVLSIDDVCKYIATTNSNSDDFPILNSYLIRKQDDDKSNIILKIGDLIYGIIFYDEITFKMYLRLNSFFVNSKLDQINSLNFSFDNIYSLIVNTDFKLSDEVFEFINQAYTYCLLTYYRKENDTYYLNLSNEELDANNSKMLSIDYRLAKDLDPLFDLALIDANRYLQEQEDIKNLNIKYNQESYSYKKELIDELNKVSQEHQNDKYVTTNYDTTIDIKLGTDIDQLNKEVEDIKQIVPSTLELENILDYVNSKNDMFSLKIDKSENIYKSPVVFNYLSNPFLLINYSNKKKLIRMNCIINKDYIDQLLLKHHFIYKVARNKYENWYTIILDSSFDSYQEIYQIILDIYNYNRIQNKEEINIITNI